MAEHLDTPPLCVPVEEPIMMRDARSLECRSPIRPPPADDSEFGVQDATLTRHSNLWTSFAAQPMMVQMVERASMDPWAATDETTNHIGSGDAFTLVSETIHTTMLRTVRNKDAPTLLRVHGWMRTRPGMRDGTTGFEWHEGPLTRCGVHILRKSEDFAMVNGVGSPEHTRHTMLQDLYRDAKHTGREVERRAGGPVRCASQLGAIRGVPGLEGFVHSSMERLTDRLDMIVDAFPHDGLTTTLQNARDDSYNALEVPGMSFHNNRVEGTIRDCVVPDRRRCRFLNERAAYNHSTMRSFAATTPERHLAVPRHHNDGQRRQMEHLQLRDTAPHIRPRRVGMREAAIRPARAALTRLHTKRNYRRTGRPRTFGCVSGMGVDFEVKRYAPTGRPVRRCFK